MLHKYSFVPVLIAQWFLHNKIHISILQTSSYQPAKILYLFSVPGIYEYVKDESSDIKSKALMDII